MALTLDNGDKLRGDTSTSSKVDFTVHGVVGTDPGQLADGQLADSIGDLYTSTADGTLLFAITLVNTHTAAESINLYLTPSGGNARRLIPKDMSLNAGHMMIYDGVKTTVLNTSGQILTTGDWGPSGPSGPTGVTGSIDCWGQPPRSGSVRWRSRRQQTEP